MHVKQQLLQQPPPSYLRSACTQPLRFKSHLYQINQYFSFDCLFNSSCFDFQHNLFETGPSCQSESSNCCYFGCFDNQMHLLLMLTRHYLLQPHYCLQHEGYWIRLFDAAECQSKEVHYAISTAPSFETK